MIRSLTIFGLTVGGFAALNAGQIQIGGTNGISANYIAGATPCAGASAGQTGLTGYSGCATGGVTNSVGTGGSNFKLLPYSNSLFSNVTSSLASITPPTVISTTDAASNPVVFDLNPSQYTGAGGTSSGVAGGTQDTTSLTIPISIFDVDKVWTILTDYYPTIGGQNTSVTFNFGSTSNQTSGFDVVNFNLTNGNQIRSAVDCTGVATNPAPNGANPTKYTGSTSSGCQQYSTTTTSPNTANAYTHTYDGDASSSSVYAATSGSVNLDDQLFSFGSGHSAEWLVNIVVANTGGLVTTTVPTSRTSLSAITVDSLASTTPEPGTMFLLFSGLGAVALARYRRR